MAEYRLYYFGADGHIVRASILEAADDAEAIRLAATHDAQAAIELWQGGRKICRFEARAVPVAVTPPNPTS